MANVRMLPPQSPQTIVVRGANTYTGTPGSFTDVPQDDIGNLPGWTPVAAVGTTAQRPKPPSMQTPFTAYAGAFYIDTTLGKAIVYDDVTNVWRDPVTGAVV